MKRGLQFFLLILFLKTGIAQDISINRIGDGANTSIRGMSIPSDKVIWVSGSNGMVGRSINGGNNWQWTSVQDYEKLDFRDIHAMDSSTAIIMAVGNPAYIFKTTDGGQTWKKTFERKLDGMFLDAMDFKNNKEGICIGDPLVVSGAAKKLFFIIRTYDGGDTWTPVPLFQLPPAQDNEAIFSASGTNISFLNHPDFEYGFVTGGTISNLFLMGRPGKPNKMVNIPINQGIASTGTFSVATDKMNKFYCIGGDYKEPGNQYDNFYYSTDAGRKWASSSVAPPFGYRSCIRIVDDKKLVACGTNGIDYSANGGKEWLDVSKEGFNVCMVSPDKNTVIFAGEKGKIARLTFNK